MTVLIDIIKLRVAEPYNASKSIRRGFTDFIAATGLDNGDDVPTVEAVYAFPSKNSPRDVFSSPFDRLARSICHPTVRYSAVIARMAAINKVLRVVHDLLFRTHPKLFNGDRPPI